jgi:hypothetical protein
MFRRKVLMAVDIDILEDGREAEGCKVFYCLIARIKRLKS